MDTRAGRGVMVSARLGGGRSVSTSSHPLGGSWSYWVRTSRSPDDALVSTDPGETTWSPRDWSTRVASSVTCRDGGGGRSAKQASMYGGASGCEREAGGPAAT